MSLSINGREIANDGRCYVIAEAGVNHNGEIRIAKRLIDAAADAGADAVKFQTFTAERLAAPSAAKADYQGTGGGQLEMLRKLELSPADHKRLFDHAARRGITFLSTPFDSQSADLLAELGLTAFKIGSGDLTDRFLLSHVATFGRPVVLSTGGASIREIRAALKVLRKAGDPDIALLHCVSSYPARVETINLRAMQTLARLFRVPVGFSDHTTGLLAPVMAVALGAAVIEKHLTLDRSMQGPDHAFSLAPPDFRRMVDQIRCAEEARGNGRKIAVEEEQPIMAVARKSLFAARRIEAGSLICEADLRALRPAAGLSPMKADRFIGHVARRRIEAGEMMTPDMAGRG